MRFKTIQRLIESGDDTERFVRVDPNLMKSRYDYWNRSLFGNELPASRFSTSKTQSYLGQTKSSSEIGPSIDISTNWKYTQRILDAVLLHEMIHVWMVANGHPEEDHGTNFMLKLKELSARVGFKIPTKNDPDELPHLVDRPGQRVLALVRNKPDGSKSAALFVPTLKANDLVTQLSRYVGSDTIKAYDTVTSIDIPVQSSLGQDVKFAFIKTDQAAEIEAGKPLN